MEKNIWVVDYGLGNLRSVSKALEKVGAKVRVGSEPELLFGAQGVVLPGVGAFDAAVRNLKDAGLFPVMFAYLKKDLPFLGICLGFQLLFAGSEEGQEAGFGIMEGTALPTPGPARSFPESRRIHNSILSILITERVKKPKLAGPNMGCLLPRRFRKGTSLPPSSIRRRAGIWD